jgi:putative ATP-dependent endonuclease of OLD family
LRAEDKITISLDLTDFESEDNLVALLAEHLVSAEPMTSRLTYVFQPIETLETAPVSDSHYGFFVYGGERGTNTISYEVRRGLPLDVLPALRDAAGDLANWRRSPLRPLLDAAIGAIDRTRLV